MKSVMTLHAVRTTELMYWLPLLAMVSLSSSQCVLTPSKGQMTGRVTGISCLEYSYPDVTFAQCALYCYLEAQCRVAYLKCESPSCFCVLCPAVEEIDFSVVDEKFFLKGRVLVKNVSFLSPSQEISIPVELFVGQVIVAKIVLPSYKINLYFTLPNGDIPLMTSFRMQTRAIVRNSATNGHWGTEERSIPHFNFSPGQEVEVVCIITQAVYRVYIDKREFFTYQHRVQTDLASIHSLGLSSSGTSGECKSLFVIF